ncbi:MAG: S8 family serine peptidase [Candidatus Promineifilaceae bacterium]|nr:S8 family serine peptidase [Candidatus Promineifilaceae bacterium]
MQSRIATPLLLAILLLAIIFAIVGMAPAASATVWQTKVDPWVLERLEDEEEGEFIVFLDEQADLSAAAHLPTKLEKGEFVYRELTATAERTQPALRAHLDALGVAYRPYWVANMIWVRGDRQVIEALARRSDVAHLYANPHVRIEQPEPDDREPLAPTTVEWNIERVNAPDVWAQGYRGQGVVVGGQDTGYEWDHPALIEQYRGWYGGAADHNYNWHDAIHSADDPCDVNGSEPQEPCDDHGHGTHTMGTIVGDDGGDNQIGMAPSAEWIGCRNMERGVGTPTTYSECFQWFLAPTDLNGENADPSRAPHVINNSWACPPSEGCTDPTVLQTVVENVRAAGIAVVVSAGNSGPFCETVDDPAAIYDASFTVGATSSSDSIAVFSSRGPVTVDGSGRPKPDISAPGVNVRSSYLGGTYHYENGTSMAAPHVTGLMALLMSAHPSLAGEVDALEWMITQTAVRLTTSQDCGDISGSEIPNNTYGWGRIDALAALYAHNLPPELALTKQAPPETWTGAPITYTLTVTNNHLLTTTHNVVLTDVIPTGTSFITATQPFTLDGNTVRWQKDALAGGETWTVTLATSTELTGTGVITNSLYGVDSDETPPLIGQPVTTTLRPLYSLEIHKTAEREWIWAGDPLTYVLAVTNTSPLSTVHNVTLTDSLPAGTTFITATQPYTLNEQVVHWTTPALAAGAAWNVSLVVGAPLSGTEQIVNADYAADGDEVNALTGTPLVTPVTGPYDLSLHKRAGTEVVQAGERITYTLTVTNRDSLSTTYNLELIDVIPDGTSLIAATPPFTLAGDTITWHRASLDVGEAWTVYLVVAVSAETAEPVVNESYGVRSDEVGFTAGPPIFTSVRWRTLLFPVLKE